MNRKVLPLLASVTMLIASSVMAEEKTNYDKKPIITSVSDAVAYCVDEVHKHKGEDSYEDKFYLNFDAYYNPATDRIIDNAMRNGDMPPQYVFRKCMTQIGVPLK